MDDVVITANHVCVIIVNYNVMKHTGVLLKMSVCCGIITEKVTGAAVKPTRSSGDAELV